MSRRQSHPGVDPKWAERSSSQMIAALGAHQDVVDDVGAESKGSQNGTSPALWWEPSTGTERTTYAVRDLSQEHLRDTSVRLTCLTASRRLASARVGCDPRADFLRTERDRPGDCRAEVASEVLADAAFRCQTGT
jgi:hypothetical protein